MRFDHIAGRAGAARNDGRVAPGKRVEEARFPRIGRASDNHPDTLPQELRSLRGIERFRHRRGQCSRFFANRRRRCRDHGIVVGEVDGGFRMGEQADDLAAPGLDRPAHGAEGLAQGGAALLRCPGGDEIGEALRRDEIEFAVTKSTQGELARLRQSQSVDAAKGSQHGGCHGDTSMDVELRAVLAGETRRTGHPNEKAPIEILACRRIGEPAECGRSRRRQRPCDRLGRLGRRGVRSAGSPRRPRHQDRKLERKSCLASSFRTRIDPSRLMAPGARRMIAP